MAGDAYGVANRLEAGPPPSLPRACHDVLVVILHTAAAVLALCSGLLVLSLRKGTIAHRRTGKIYVAAILVLCASSAFIHEINGELSIFHLITVQTLAFVGAGLVALVLRDRLEHWYVWHLRFMLYSYVTLIVTGIAQAFEHLPLGTDLLNAIVFIQAPAVIGWALIEFRGLPHWRRTVAPASSSAS